jgi:hypothetical protein
VIVVNQHIKDFAQLVYTFWLELVSGIDKYPISFV